MKFVLLCYPDVYVSKFFSEKLVLILFCNSLSNNLIANVIQSCTVALYELPCSLALGCNRFRLQPYTSRCAILCFILAVPLQDPATGSLQHLHTNGLIDVGNSIVTCQNVHLKYFSWPSSKITKSLGQKLQVKYRYILLFTSDYVS